MCMADGASACGARAWCGRVWHAWRARRQRWQRRRRRCCARFCSADLNIIRAGFLEKLAKRDAKQAAAYQQCVFRIGGTSSFWVNPKLRLESITKNANFMRMDIGNTAEAIHTPKRGPGPQSPSQKFILHFDVALPEEANKIKAEIMEAQRELERKTVPVQPNKKLGALRAAPPPVPGLAGEIPPSPVKEVRWRAHTPHSRVFIAAVVVPRASILRARA